MNSTSRYLKAAPAPSLYESVRRSRRSWRHVALVLLLASAACEEEAPPTPDASTPSAPPPGPPTPTPPGTCPRELLETTVDRYFVALTAHDASSLPLSPNVRYTENGQLVQVGEGVWRTAGAQKFKRSALDTETCSSVTEGVIVNTHSVPTSFLGGLFGGGSVSGGTQVSDFVIGLRLRLAGGKITEIESILVGPDGWFPNPAAVIASASDDWESVLPASQRPTRAALEQLIDDYFELFGGGTLSAYPFAADCVRLENGFSPGACNFGIIGGLGGMTPRLYVIDVEAGVAAGFVMFAGAYTDFHMIKVRAGEVKGVHAVLAAASGSGWN